MICPVQVITGAKPGSVAALMPSWMYVLWLLMIGVGSLVALAGIARRADGEGMLWEYIGLGPTAFGMGMYGLVQVLYGGLGALMASSLSFFLATAYTWRWWELRRTLRYIKNWSED